MKICRKSVDIREVKHRLQAPCIGQIERIECPAENGADGRTRDTPSVLKSLRESQSSTWKSKECKIKDK